MTPHYPPDATVHTDRSAFAAALPLENDVGHDLWPHLDPETTAILEVEPNIKRNLCDTRSLRGIGDHHFVIAEIQADTGPGGALNLTNGACLREAHDVAEKLARSKHRLQEARFGARDDDVDELERVVDVLRDRIKDRTGFTTGFYDEWVPRQAVVECHGRGATATDDTPGAGNDGVQTRIPQGGE